MLDAFKRKSMSPAVKSALWHFSFILRWCISIATLKPFSNFFICINIVFEHDRWHSGGGCLVENIQCNVCNLSWTNWVKAEAANLQISSGLCTFQHVPLSANTNNFTLLSLYGRRHQGHCLSCVCVCVCQQKIMQKGLICHCGVLLEDIEDNM